MTTHELAATLEVLKALPGQKLDFSASLAEAATGFRELPDQNLRAFLALVRRAATPQPAVANGSQSTAAGASGVVTRIRAIRDGSAPANEVVDLNGLRTNDQLKEVLRAFNKPHSGTKAELISRIRQLCVRAESAAPVPPPSAPPDSATVHQGVVLYKKLEQDRQLSLAEVQAGFTPLRELPKAVLEEISRQVGYTPAGSREEILERLLKNLEGIKMNQHRADRILTGTSG
jgi:hypothetical protein